MVNKAFNLICNTVGEKLTTQGFTKVNAESSNDNELVALYTSETIAYSIIYYKDKMHMVMRQCTMTYDGPDNEWKTLATWMFNPETDTEKEAQSIANDFVDNVTSKVAIKRQKQTKKKKKANSDEGNADPLFLSKRLVNIFPELKEEINNEQDCYYPFRGVTFAKEHIVPKVNKLVKNGNKKEIEKLIGILSAQYVNGDADTRSIISIVILNSIDPEYDDMLREYMGDELKKDFSYSVKFRGKQVKPEKVKKKKKIIAQRL